MRMSKHARERATDMEISEGEILDIIANPEIDYEQRVYQGKPTTGDRHIARRGDIAVAYDKQSQVVITVLWSKPGVEEWDRSNDRARGQQRKAHR